MASPALGTLLELFMRFFSPGVVNWQLKGNPFLQTPDLYTGWFGVCLKRESASKPYPQGAFPRGSYSSHKWLKNQYLS